MVLDNERVFLSPVSLYKKVAGATGTDNSWPFSLNDVVSDMFRTILSLLLMFPRVVAQGNASSDLPVVNGTGFDSESNKGNSDLVLILGNIATGIFVLGLCCGFRRVLKCPGPARNRVSPATRELSFVPLQILPAAGNNSVADGT